MSELYELLKQKELELQKVSQEVDALRLTIRLVEEGRNSAREAARVAPSPFVPALAATSSQEPLPRTSQGPNPVKSFDNGSNGKFLKQFP